jgi:hypothetical protein
MKNCVFSDVSPCDSCENRRFGGAKFPETSVPTRATQRHIPEDDILHSRRRENLKSFIALSAWAL